MRSVVSLMMKAGIIRRLVGHERCARYIGVTIGRDCRILSSNFGSEPFLIEIGDNVTISVDVLFSTHDGAAWLIRDERGRRYVYRRIKIGSHCFVGARAIILPGVVIGSEVIVGAGAVVTRSVPSGAVVAGAPARIIGTYEAYRERILANPSEADLANAPDFRARVMAALDETMSPFLT